VRQTIATPPIYVPGQAAPFFSFIPPSGKPFVFGSHGGRYVTLTFFGSDGDALTKAFAPWFKIFDIAQKCFIGLSETAHIFEALSGAQNGEHVQIFEDPQNAVRRSFSLPPGQSFTFILDPALRVLRFVAEPDAQSHAAQVMDYVSRLSLSGPVGRAASGAPVLLIDNVFDADLIQALMAEYDRAGGDLSGFMRTSPEGKTIHVQDYNHKVRRDCLVEDDALRTRCRNAIRVALIPAIARAFQFEVTRIERYLIGCYEPEDGGVPGGHFNRHRDNTTRGTAHRRFAVSIGLDADAYDGGDIRFPEFDQRSYRPPTGGAVVFSCSLLHEVSPVTRGRRMAFLPFLFDEAAEKIRQENLKYLDTAAA
jgi:predicted 2-oxoglutarate/Fe(II)-dependent dioxygenase YbiX